MKTYRGALLGALCAVLMIPHLTSAQGPPAVETPKGETYLPVVIEEDFQTIRERDTAVKPGVMPRQIDLLNARYDLSNRPATGVMMSGERKQGVRVKLPAGITWEQLSAMPPEGIRDRDLLPRGLLPLPHVKHETGGMVFLRHTSMRFGGRKGGRLSGLMWTSICRSIYCRSFPHPSS